MDWQLVNKARGAEQRIAVFVSLQRFRYDNTPEEAALAVWKGYQCHDIGQQLFSDLSRLKDGVAQIMDLDARSYLTRLLKALTILEHLADQAGQPQS